jgi:hypothetical protein
MTRGVSEKRKREDSPEKGSRSRQKRVNTETIGQPTLQFKPDKHDKSKIWISHIDNGDSISQEHAQATCGFGPLGHYRMCTNRYARTALRSINEGPEVIVIDEEEEEEVPCSKTRCKTNPYCLNFLNQEKWEDPRKLASFYSNGT